MYVGVHCATYVTSFVTVSATTGFHPANVYVYVASAAFVGLSIVGVESP